MGVKISKISHFFLKEKKKNKITKIYELVRILMEFSKIHVGTNGSYSLRYRE
jgi:hypothetical protein